MSGFPWRRVWALVAYLGLAAIPLAGVSLKVLMRDPLGGSIGWAGLFLSILVGGTALGLARRRRWAWISAAAIFTVAAGIAFVPIFIGVVWQGSPSRLALSVLPLVYVVPALACAVSCRSEYFASTRT